LRSQSVAAQRLSLNTDTWRGQTREGNEFNRVISKVGECLEYDDEERALKSLGEGWIGEEAVALALYCFLKYPDDYIQTVLRGANTNGDSDSVACIAGGISGVYLSIEGIPRKWILSIEKAKHLEELADSLSSAKIRSVKTRALF